MAIGRGPPVDMARGRLRHPTKESLSRCRELEQIKAIAQVREKTWAKNCKSINNIYQC